MSLLKSVLHFLTGTGVTAGAVAFLFAGAIFGCSSDGDTGSDATCDAPDGPVITLKIGALEPGSGSSANDVWISILQMARDEMNAALACNSAGKNIRFELIERDDGNDASIVAEMVDAMIADGALGLYSDTSGVSATANGLNYDPDNPRNIPIVCSPCTHTAFNSETASPPSMPNPGPDFTEAQWADAHADPDNWLRRTSIPGDPGLGLSQRILYARGDNGDLNDDGVVKLALYSSSAPCSDGQLLAHLDDTSRFRCEWVLGPSSTEDPNSWATFEEEAGMLLDEANGTAVGTAYPSALVTDTAFLDAEVGGVAFGSYFTVDADAKTIITAGALPDDGVPDYVFNVLTPAFSLGSMQAFNRLAPAEEFPWITVQTKNSFVRGSNLVLLGAEAEGIEGLANILYSRDESGRTFAANFEKAHMMQVAGFDAAVYDAMVSLMLGILKAALPLDDPSAVTREAVRDALDQINNKSGETIRVGTDAFSEAITLIAAGSAVDFAGASGPVDFDSVGNVQENLEFYKVVDGRWTTQYIFDCVSDPETCPTIDCEAEPSKCE